MATLLLYGARDVARRSWLLVPLSDEALVEEAWAHGADVVVLDLTELVPEEAKPMARNRARDAIDAAGRGGAQIFAQVDMDLLYADLKACVWPGLRGVVLSRVESSGGVLEADLLLTQLEGERGLMPGSVQLVASLETAQGNHNAMQIARSCPRLWGLTLGRADLVMDLRPEPSGEIHLMPYLMQRLVIVANAAGLAPLGAWWREPARGLQASPRDTREAALRDRRIGFKGSMCVLPEQVEALNTGFTAGDEELARAKRLVEGYHDRPDPHLASFQVDGVLSGLGAVSAAQDVIHFQELCASRDGEKARAMARAAQAASGQEDDDE